MGILRGPSSFTRDFVIACEKTVDTQQDQSSREINVPIVKLPKRLILPGLPQFVALRGGEYCFMPGLGALKWISELDSGTPLIAKNS
jgi:hypothetical protein